MDAASETTSTPLIHPVGTWSTHKILNNQKLYRGRTGTACLCRQPHCNLRTSWYASSICIVRVDIVAIAPSSLVTAAFTMFTPVTSTSGGAVPWGGVGPSICALQSAQYLLMNSIHCWCPTDHTGVLLHRSPPRQILRPDSGGRPVHHHVPNSSNQP
jgi:hypothetical protein